MLALALCALALPGALRAQQQPAWEMEALNDQGWAEFDFQTGLGRGTNGVLVRYGNAFLTADQVSVNQQSGEVTADGQVRIQSEDQIWVGEHIRYNFKTSQMEAEQFRTGKAPVFADRRGASWRIHQPRVYATNGVITTDDSAEPAIKVRAKYLKIIPGREGRGAPRDALRGGCARLLFSVLLAEARAAVRTTSALFPAIAAASGRSCSAATRSS